MTRSRIRTVGDEVDADGELPAEDLHLGLLGLEAPHAVLEARGALGGGGRGRAERVRDRPRRQRAQVVAVVVVVVLLPRHHRRRRSSLRAVGSCHVRE